MQDHIFILYIIHLHFFIIPHSLFGAPVFFSVIVSQHVCFNFLRLHIARDTKTMKIRDSPSFEYHTNQSTHEEQLTVCKNQFVEIQISKMMCWGLMVIQYNTKDSEVLKNHQNRTKCIVYCLSDVFKIDWSF